MCTTEISPQLTLDYFNLINFDYNFILEHSETSDNRSYITSNIITEPSLKE